MADGFGKFIALSMAGKRNPWGDKPSDGEPASGDDAPGTPGDTPAGDAPKKDTGRGPRNPWLPPASEGGTRRPPNLEDLFRPRDPQGPRSGGGGGRGFRLPPRADGRSWFPLAIGGIVGLWLIVTSVHQVQPKEQGIVTWLGGPYSTTLGPGLNFTLPWPIQQVSIENVSEIRGLKIGTGGEKLVLTGDQNLVDLSYTVRWNIKDLRNFTFQIDDPLLTLGEVAEAAMRASVAEQALDAVVSGEGRAEIEGRVQRRMQGVLDAYRSGIAIQGIAIEKADPPEKVVEAFKQVSAAQQEADAMRNRSRAYAQQVLARAQGDAAAFDQIYAQYKLAPEVTRRRLYYETMEQVLSQTDKTIVETGNVTPYLPLPEIRRRAQQGGSTVTAPAPAPATREGN